MKKIVFMGWVEQKNYEPNPQNHSVEQLQLVLKVNAFKDGDNKREINPRYLSFRFKTLDKSLVHVDNIKIGDYIHIEVHCDTINLTDIEDAEVIITNAINSQKAEA